MVVLLIAHGLGPTDLVLAYEREEIIFWTPSLVMPFPPTLHQVVGQHIIQVLGDFPVLFQKCFSSTGCIDLCVDHIHCEVLSMMVKHISPMDVTPEVATSQVGSRLDS